MTKLRRGLSLIAIASGCAYMGKASIYTVDAGHRAVVHDRLHGVQQQVVGEGSHLKIPFVQYPHLFEIRAKPVDICITTFSRDSQTISIALRVLVHLDETKLPQIYQELGKDVAEGVISSIGTEVLKSVLTQYTAAELLTQRTEVLRKIRSTLQERAKELYLILDDVSVIDLTFSADFIAANSESS